MHRSTGYFLGQKRDGETCVERPTRGQQLIFPPGPCEQVNPALIAGIKQWFVNFPFSVYTLPYDAFFHNLAGLSLVGK